MPVPPRSNLGVFGALRATLELGFEVLMALISVVFEEGLARVERLGSIAKGAQALERAAAPFRPERVARFTGIPEGVIRRIARQLAASERARRMQGA